MQNVLLKTNVVEVFEINTELVSSIMGKCFAQMTDAIKDFGDYVDSANEKSSKNARVYTAIANSINSAFGIKDRSEASPEQLIYIANAYKMVALITKIGMIQGLTRKKIKALRKSIIQLCAINAESGILFIESNVETFIRLEK